jgi:hypothetical protein
MSDILDLTEARNRGLDLPTDDTAAQNILDETEAWLARKIGPLTGDRTETFYAGVYSVSGALGLKRFTDAVTVTDGGSAVDPSQVRLVREGAAVTHTYVAPSAIWRGPYIGVTYEPNDLLEVTRALYALVELELSPEAGEITGETIGSYSYQRGAGFAQVPKGHKQAAIVSALLPKSNQLQTIYASSRPVTPDDPRINAPEYEPYPI